MLSSILSLMLESLLLFVGLGVLWLGAELAIQGTMNIGDHFRLSHRFMGLTVLALGTDLPELFIDVSASIKRLQGIETSGLILGETVGTCFSQVGLALGLIGLVAVVKVKKRAFKRDIFMLIAASVLLFILSLNGVISRTEGAILILAYVTYLATVFRENRVHKKFVLFRPKLRLLWSLSSMLAGFVLLVFGSQLTIDYALLIGERFDLVQHFIGILIVGIGTSIPEIATSLTAVRRRAGQLAVANLIGSNIFDILFTLGISSTISGFLVHSSLVRFDIPLLILLSVIVAFFFRNMRLEKWEAFSLIAFFGLYYGYRLTEVLPIV